MKPPWVARDRAFGFLGPIALVIMGALEVATGLTLLALPAMYAAFFRAQRDVSGAG